VRGQRGKPALDRDDVLAQAQAARASRARRRGAVMIALGVAVVPVIGAITFVIYYDQARNSGGSSASVPLSITLAVGIALSGPLLLRGRRLRAKGAEDVLSHDERPPIVYLRSFESDKVSMTPSLRSRRRVRPRRDMVGAGGVRKTWELRLADLLGDVGPFVTIGDPTETLPRVGAARLYAGDDGWHQTVEDLIGRGGTIILHAGDSPGLDWEVERIVALDEPERLILSLPLGADKHREQRYATFRTRFGDEFPRGLPDGAGESQFVYFDADWTPHRLEESAAMPAEPAPGSDREQRTLVLRKLAPEFKLMWGPLWARALIYTAVPVVLVVLAGLLASNSRPSRSSPPPLDVNRVAHDIEPVLQQQLRTKLGDGSAIVTSLTCVATSGTAATCRASASDGHGHPAQLTIAATLDPKSNRLAWHVVG
jgi:hypothetical protein